MGVIPRIEEVRVIEKRLIYIKFNDGKEKVYDMSELIKNNKFYKKLEDEEYFKKVKPRGVTVEWPDGEDVCPENLYYESKDYIV